MEESENFHDLNIEWGCITNLLDKIVNFEDKIDGGWPELVDMVSDAMTEEGSLKDPTSAFFNLYSFMFRLYYRLKANPEKEKFNIYEHTIWGSKKEDVYIIRNYDYSVFKWALKFGFTDRIDNYKVIVPKDKLTTTQQRAFQHRCEKEEK